MKINEVIGEQIEPEVWTELRAKGLVKPMEYDSPEARAAYKAQGKPYEPDISIITKDNLDQMRGEEPERLKQLKPIQVSDQEWIKFMTDWWKVDRPKAPEKTQQIKNAYKLLYKKDMAEWIIMPQSIKPMGLIKKPGGGFDFKNKGNNRANEKAPPGREKQVKALKGKVDNPYAVAWASYNKSKGKTNEAPIEQDHNNPIAKPYVDMPEWKALHDMDDKIIDAYIKHKEVKEADEFAPARALGEAEYMLEYSYKMAIDHLEDRHNEANIKAGVIKERIPALLEKIKKLYKNEDAAGVGIITKQNTTQDVKPGETQRQAKKLHLS